MHIGVQAGAIFVNQTAMEYFEMLFQSAGFDKEDLHAYTQEAVDSFEAEGKKAFEGPNQEDISVKVGGHRLTERAVNIRRGIMAVTRFVKIVFTLDPLTNVGYAARKSRSSSPLG